MPVARCGYGLLPTRVASAAYNAFLVSISKQIITTFNPTTSATVALGTSGQATSLWPRSTNALTFITVQSRATGNLLRGVPYQGLMWFCASEFIRSLGRYRNPFPDFPYSRYAVIDKGLFGRNAIAGWEDGFGQLMFVGNDAGVYQMNGVAPVKVSPPDLDRLIAAIPQAQADTLICFVYTETGKAVLRRCSHRLGVGSSISIP